MKYARALVRMPAEFDGDHGIARAASNHARRTAGAGQAGNIQNLSMPTTMRSALSASPSSKAHIRAALMLGRSLPMGLVPSGSTAPPRVAVRRHRKFSSNMPMRKRVLLIKGEHIEPHLTAIAISVPRKCGRTAHLGAKQLSFARTFLRNVLYV